MTDLLRKREPSKRDQLLQLIVDHKEYASGARLDGASIKMLKRDIDRMGNRHVDDLLLHYTPGTNQHVW